MKKAAVIVLLLLSLLFIASEEMAGAEGRTCESPSKKFKGLCVSNSNCGSICQSEGFTDGQCKGLRRRCICLRPCDDDGDN